MPAATRTPRASAPPIRLGFVPLNDCAPLVVARERGLFAKAGVEVRLSRELGWASVRDQIAHGELDDAHAPTADKSAWIARHLLDGAAKAAFTPARSPRSSAPTSTPRRADCAPLP